MFKVKTVCSMLVALFGITATAEAGWLVLHDGTALEIEGTPETRGKMVVFTLSSGELASLRASEVDFAASARRTEFEHRKRTETKPKPRTEPQKEAVFVLTDADVSHVAPARPPAENEAEVEEESSPGGPQEIVVRQWGRGDSDRGVLIFGVLENRDQNAAGAVELIVTVLDDQGKPMAQMPALVEIRTLLPGQTTRFEAAFDDLPPFNTLDFAPSSTAMEIGWAEDFTLIKTDHL